MINPKEKLRRFSSPRFINVNFNDVVMKCINTSPILDGYHKLSAVLRFDTFHEDIRYPVYKMLMLVDNKIYCYNKLSKRKIIDLEGYSSIMEFESISEAVSSWEKYIRNEIL